MSSFDVAAQYHSGLSPLPALLTAPGATSRLQGRTCDSSSPMPAIPFDQRDGVMWFHGKLVPWKDAKVHVLTHGLHYGSCVFEGERAYDGVIYKCTEHSKRFQ